MYLSNVLFFLKIIKRKGLTSSGPVYNVLLTRGNTMRIRHNHPDLKGSFTCLGNWYNVLNKESMEKCEEIVKSCNKTDQRTARKEIAEAREAVKRWEPVSCLSFLYDRYHEENA